MKRYLELFILIACLITQIETAKATHIVGGGFTYKYLSKNFYEISLEYYKDCSASAVDYPPGNIRIGIYRMTDNVLVQSLDLIPGPITQVDFLTGVCTTSTVTCVQKRIYADTLYTSPITFTDPLGYYFTYEQCCRNFGIKNIMNPDESGMAFYSTFPPTTKNGNDFVNSSPTLNIEQNLYLCTQEPFVADYSHTDVDGDSLVYKIVDPLIGTTNPVLNNSNGISILNPKPYPPVNWNTGYGPVASNIMDGNPDVTINSKTGLLNITPTQNGIYSFAIEITEYRKGVLIAESRREIQYQIIICPTRTPPEITWLNPENDTLKADSITCLSFSAKDIDLSDSLRVVINSVTSHLKNQIIDLQVDSTIKNNLKINLCISVKCDQVDALNESLSLIVADRSCPFEYYDTLNVNLTLLSKVQNKPTITWVNSTQDKIASNTYTCFDFEGIDIDTWDSLKFSFDSLSSYFLNQTFHVNIDSSFKNKLKASICFKTDCSLKLNSNERFRVSVSDNSCPTPKIGSLWVDVEIEGFVGVDPLDNIPNIFTPNGDGINDFFSVNKKMPKSCFEEFEIIIYNRWGDVVYKTENFEFEWSGDGHPSGVYFYVIKLGDRKQVGHLTIMY